MTRRSRAFSLVEVLIASVVFTAFIVVLSYFLIDTLKAQAVVSAQYGMQTAGRMQLDVMMNDVRGSSGVLASATVGSTTYTTDTSSALVLALPSYDSNHNALGSFDTVVYHLTGATAPYRLCRIVQPAAGSSRQAVIDQPLVPNVSALNMTYLVDQSIPGDGATKSFTLAAAPYSSSPTVIQNGLTLAYGAGSGQEYLAPPQTLNFGTAPSAVDAIDVQYIVQPGSSAPAVTAVDVSLQMTVPASSLGNGIQPQSLTLESKSCLLNH